MKEITSIKIEIIGGKVFVNFQGTEIEMKTSVFNNMSVSRFLTEMKTNLKKYKKVDR